MFLGGFSVLNFNEKLKREHCMLTWFCTQLWKSSCRLSEVKSLFLKLLCFALSKFSLSALTSRLPTLTSHCSLFLSASLCPALSPPLFLPATLVPCSLWRHQANCNVEKSSHSLMKMPCFCCPHGHGQRGATIWSTHSPRVTPPKDVDSGSAFSLLIQIFEHDSNVTNLPWLPVAIYFISLMTVK